MFGPLSTALLPYYDNLHDSLTTAVRYRPDVYGQRSFEELFLLAHFGSSPYYSFFSRFYYFLIKLSEVFLLVPLASKFSCSVALLQSF